MINELNKFLTAYWMDPRYPILIHEAHRKLFSVKFRKNSRFNRTQENFLATVCYLQTTLLVALPKDVNKDTLG